MNGGVNLRQVASNAMALAMDAPAFAGRTSISIVRYVIANLWTLLPITLAFLVVAAAMAEIQVAVPCAKPPKNNANWFLCSGALNHGPALNVFLSTAKDAVQANQTVSNHEALALVAAEARKGAQAKVYASKRTVPVNEELSPAEAAFQKDTMRAAREATARIVWSSSFVTLLLIATLVSIASILLMGQGLIGHWRTTASGSGTRRIDLDTLGGLISRVVRFILLSLLILAIAFFVVIKFTALLIGAHTLGISAALSWLSSNTSVFTDEITVWLEKNWDPAQFRFLTLAGRRALFVSVVLLAMLVSSTLFQSPDDVTFRADGTAPSIQGASYLRYLGRSFRRLKLAIYLGAALLVVLTAEISAQYSWALSYLDNIATEPGKTLAAFTEQVTTTIGFGFTLVLAALYFPAIILIRERARDYYRARHPTDTLQQQDAFLSEQGLIVTLPNSYSDFLALLAPLATAPIAKLFSALGQQ